jgi:uncharacterized membrane protein YraQ (UPF0718 family)
VITASVLSQTGESLKMAFFMLWATLWALILGFGLSGAVQAFVSKDSMERVMGEHGPAAVTRASAFGMASSSCSYATVAMAKSLFQKRRRLHHRHGVHVRQHQPGGGARPRAAHPDEGGTIRRGA